MSESRSPALIAWIREYVAEASRDEAVAVFVQEVDNVILSQVPEVAEDPILVEDLRASTTSQWRAFLAMIDGEYGLHLPAPAYGLALSLARRGMDLGTLLKVYRVGNQAVFNALTKTIDGAGGDAPARDEILVFIWTRAARWLDDAVEALTETFVGERQRLRDSAATRRADSIGALLGVNPPSATVAEKALAHPLQHWQTAGVAWADENLGRTPAEVAEVSGELGKALGAPPPLATMAGSRDLWWWAATPRPPDVHLLADLRQEIEQRGLRVAVGRPSTGVAGFRSSHAEARAAQALALRSPAAPRLTCFADVELLCLVADQPELTHRMVAREAGALVGDDKNLDVLRETVLTHLMTFSVEVTAARLFVHKNTVRYRIARAEELLGHPLTERSTWLELALRWIAYFGPPTP
ncbi:hypothetical protein DJ010_00585 [Nocardioides silvaticus]|uniref:PucR family transcriptional regulator n=1 Tax=Nocardioides silvaticus TaxID=2201891 RepID=A0A316TI26_9ACTN|nr:PucR family transcriptional regulator [Nocardioides silvaticus]PWN04187.1 hypothetical protein DJ010_00585 [Nocardioides silvaticus]